MSKVRLPGMSKVRNTTAYHSQSLEPFHQDKVIKKKTKTKQQNTRISKTSSAVIAITVAVKIHITTV